MSSVRLVPSGYGFACTATLDVGVLALSIAPRAQSPVVASWRDKACTADRADRVSGRSARLLDDVPRRTSGSDCADCGSSCGRKFSGLALSAYFSTAQGVLSSGAALGALAVWGWLLSGWCCLARRQAGLVGILSRFVAARLDSANAGKAKLADGLRGPSRDSLCGCGGRVVP